MTRYTPERGWGLDLSGPEPVWRGKRPGWKHRFAGEGYGRNYGKHAQGISRTRIHRENLPIWVPHYRINEYIQRGLIDPARLDDL